MAGSKWETEETNQFAIENQKLEEEWRKKRRLEKKRKRKILEEEEKAEERNIDACRLYLMGNTPELKSCNSIDDYEILEKIEEGSYGIVYRGLDKSTNTLVALKKIKFDPNGIGFPITSLREIESLSSIRHDNIVELEKVVVGKDLKDVYLVMEFMEHDLKTLLDNMPEDFLQSEVKTLMLQLLAATAFMHHHWYLHRDLKPSNLLMNNTGEIKLADFGLARPVSEPKSSLTRLVVTLWYRAPELLLGAPSYGKEIDMWSIGCIFAEMITRTPLFSGKSELDQLYKIFNLLGYPTREEWPQYFLLPYANKIKHPTVPTHSKIRTSIPNLTGNAYDLLNRLLSLNPAKRISAKEALEHPYFYESPRPKDPKFFPTFPSKAKGESKEKNVFQSFRSASPKK
ncbi:Cdk11-cyclinL compex kinase subunit Cdk11 [Schizosaccharomyces pombe]|uniref:Serine/threonine-protein kinase ppk23 n=1 Tax=Schizosaccharomyces pombe (strain 972 / ATCC 24843) TaxID=284812 RepID=PPK23_SCHPO|nr:serine/threonine protein kinase Ppk23 [Schizosaccharomyces pombe]O60145.1 RecName: Full=Serine/threonine-protein kinase ppk23 [Schizosaccharomyces pombe 972h-]CAA18412.1 serine/threonine protein kinase Ppk23 [Schizosaccharomyces pombe]|eukprot:NP_595739.1 serine/threonine protein kinase Ppk23 [Schizosaccharomyces pombe]